MYAIIAGGRPSQARRLESSESRPFCTFHPRVSRDFIATVLGSSSSRGANAAGMSARAPASAFGNWPIEVLLDAKVEDAEKFQIVFAGGIHDGLSAAMVSALAVAPPVERGMQIGVLMGTATCSPTRPSLRRDHRGVSAAGAGLPETVLLESGVGHATRCVESICRGIHRAQARIHPGQGKSNDEIRVELELFNIGRCGSPRRGSTRYRSARAPRQSQLVAVDLDNATPQWHVHDWSGRGTPQPSRSRWPTFMPRYSSGASRFAGELAAEPLPWQKADALAAKHVSTADIAIVGMACMFPKANDCARFWQNIVNRVDASKNAGGALVAARIHFTKTDCEPVILSTPNGVASSARSSSIR